MGVGAGVGGRGGAGGAVCLKASRAKFEVNTGQWLFLVCKQSIHRGDWRPFQGGNL